MAYQESERNHAPFIITDHTPGGLYHIGDFVQKAQEFGISQLVLADTTIEHFSAFDRECREHGIAPVFGFSFDLEFPQQSRVTVLAETEEGLRRITNLYVRSLKRKLRSDDLAFPDSGIAIIADSRAYGQLGYDISPEHLFFGVSALSFEEDLREAIRLEARPVLVDTVVRPSPDNFDADYYASLVINAQKHGVRIPLNVLDGGFAPDIPSSIPYTWSYIQSQDDVETLLSSYDIPEDAVQTVLHNTETLFQHISCHSLPEIEIPQYPNEGAETAFSLIVERIEAAMREKHIPQTSENMKRIQDELDVYVAMQRIDGLLFADDIVRLARINHIAVFGMGSATCSYINYVLGITNVDPIALGLPFERFLNYQTEKMTDTDWSVDTNRREELLSHVYEKLLETGVLYFHITARHTYGTNGAFRAVLEVFGYSPSDISHIEEKLVQNVPVDKRIRQMEQIAHDIADRNISKGITSLHSSKIILSRQTEFPGIALTQRKNKNVLHIDRHDAEFFLNFDFVSSRALAFLARVLNRVGIDWSDIEITQDLVSDIFEDPSGIPFVGTPWLTDVLTQYRYAARHGNISPDFNDLVDAIALSRPGASKSLGDYLIRLSNAGSIDETTSPIVLAETYGIIIFQEQVLSIAKDYAGFSASDAEKLRRAMTKERTEDVFSKYRDLFIAGSIDRGHSRGDSTRLYEMISEFAKYGFLKGHAYALITNICLPAAYLKKYYPDVYFDQLW